MLGDLVIYSKNSELLAILPKYLAVNWEIKFKEFGLGEIELERTNEIVELLTKNKYLFLFQDDIQAVVTGYKIGETVTVFLRTTEWLLTKYTVKKFKVKELVKDEDNGKWTISRLIEYILKKYLHKDFNLIFSGIENDESDVSDFISENLETVYNVIRNILTDDKYGFKFYWDREREGFVFSLLCAKENEEIFLCDEYKTAYESEYNFDLQEEISGGVFYQSVTDMGEWNAAGNIPRIDITPDNFGKYYKVISPAFALGYNLEVGDIILCKKRNGTFEKVEKAEPFLAIIEPEDNGIFSFSGVLTSKDIKGAEEEIKKTKVLDMLTCKTKLLYKENFNLGDIVKVKFFGDSLSYEKKKLVSEIHLWDEPNDTGVMPTTIDIS